MADFTVGQATLRLVPSFSGFAEAVDAQAEKIGQSAGSTFADAFSERVASGTSDALGTQDADAAQKGSSAGGAFADAFRTRVDAALKSLPNVKIDADSSQTDRKLAEIRAELEELSGKTIGVDISDGEALSKLAELRVALADINRSSESVQVRVDTGDAITELVALKAAADAAGTSSDGAGGGIEGLGEDAGGSIGAVGGLATALAGLAVALVPIAGLAAGALAALPSLLAGAAAGAGALKLGLGGISGALSAFSQQQNKAPSSGGGGGGPTAAQQASQAISNAATIRNAAQSVVSAQEGVHSANEQVASSEQNLEAAQQAETNAQVALTQARIDAANQLQNYKDQLADGALAAQQDALNLAQAQAQLATDSAPNSGASGLTVQQDQLSVAQATQAIQDQKDQYSQLQQAASAASAAGVDGSTQVTAAQQQLTAATQGVASAQQAVADANQKLADANTAVTTALQNQSDALAQIALQSDGGGGGGGAAGGVNAFDAAMAKLTPTGREFVLFLLGLENQLNALKAQTQDALLPGLQAGLTAMEPLFQAIAPFIVEAATGIGLFVAQLGTLLGSSSEVAQISAIFQAGAGFMAQMGQALLDLVPAFTTIGQQGAPIVSALGDGVKHLADAFAKWVSNGGFQGFLEWLKANGPAIVSDISGFLTGIGKLFVALAPVGLVLDKAVGLLGKFLGFLAQSPALLAGTSLAVGALGVALVVALDSNPIGLIITAIGLLVVGITELATHWDAVFADIKQVFDDAVNFLQSGFGTLVVLILGPLAPIALVALHWEQLWSGMQAIASAVWGTLGPIFDDVKTLGLDVINAGVFVLGIAWNTFWSGASAIVSTAWTAISATIGLIKTGINDVITVVNDFIKGYNAIPLLPNVDTIPPIPTGNTPAGKAAGGPVYPNTDYIVGEKGPELLRMGALGGYVVPNHNLAGVAAGGGSSAPAVVINDPVFQSDVDVSAVMMQATFLRNAGRL